MGLALTTPAASDPVTKAEFKTHAYIEIDDDDDYINTLISSATLECERYLWRQLVTATYTLTLDSFPVDDYIDMPRPPLIDITQIQYYDTANTLQTFSSDSWDYDATCEPGRIYVDRSVGWPSTYDRRNAITITYRAGYGDADDVPQPLKTAIKLLAAHRYENREHVITGISVSEVPMGITRLLDLYKFRNELNINRLALTTAV